MQLRVNTVQKNATAGPSRLPIRSGGEGAGAADTQPAELVRARIPGTSAWALNAPQLVAALSAHEEPVLIWGAPGSGKAMLARLIHDASARQNRPFVVLPANGFGEHVLRSLLFDVPATLPPAIRQLRAEYGMQAAGGTIYVGDVAEVSTELVHQIADFVDNRPSEHARRRLLRECDVRLVFGASSEIDGRRTCANIVRIPNLSERASDIIPLAEMFAAAMCARLGREPRAIDPAALKALESHTWPGNVGELKRVVDVAVRRSGPPAIGLQELPVHISGKVDHRTDPAGIIGGGIVLHEEVERYERQLLSAALERCAGVQTHAARLLGMPVTTLNSKLAVHGIDATAFKVSCRQSRQRPAVEMTA